MKYKQKVDFLTAIMLILVGIIMLGTPIIKITTMRYLFFTIMLIYALANLMQFILTHKSKDYEGLYTAFVSFAVGIVGITFKFNNPIQLSLSLLAWVFLMAIVKLVKTNYYHDMNDRMYKFRILSLVIFIILGILTSINLYYDATTDVVILGFFFFFHGVLELLDPMIKSLIK